MFGVTWEVVRWERIFHFVDIGLKLVNFELINKQRKKQQLSFVSNTTAKSSSVL